MNEKSLSNTQELLAEAKRSILFTTARPEVVMEKGEGLYLRDTDGKKIWILSAVGQLHRWGTVRRSSQRHWRDRAEFS